MRIIFIGTVDFSRHCLKQILECSSDVIAIFALLRDYATFNSDYSDLGDVALFYGIPLYRIKNINKPENIELIRSLQPDIIFVFGWSQLISKQILQIPSKGCVGSHPALLPKNRGRHPIIWALVEGLDKSGLTFFYLNEGVDSGDILWQKSFQITLNDDAGSLYKKIIVLAREAIRQFLPQLEQGTAPRIKQDSNKATYWRKRNEKDGEINWIMPSIKIYNLIRALTYPYVGAYTFLANKKIKIWRAKIPQKPIPLEAMNLSPGYIFSSNNHIFNVKTGDGYLKVLEYEVSNGTSIKVGNILGEIL